MSLHVRAIGIAAILSICIGSGVADATPPNVPYGIHQTTLTASAATIQPFAANVRCYGRGAHRLTNGVQAIVPTNVANGNYSCYLNIDRNYSNIAVQSLQYNLNKTEKAGLYQDGYFGTDTFNAVKHVQKKYGAYPIDGVYGPTTGGKMYWYHALSGVSARWS